MTERIEFKTRDNKNILISVGDMIENLDPRRVIRRRQTVTGFTATHMLLSHYNSKKSKISIRRFVHTYGHKNGFKKV